MQEETLQGQTVEHQVQDLQSRGESLFNDFQQRSIENFQGFLLLLSNFLAAAIYLTRASAQGIIVLSPRKRMITRRCDVGVHVTLRAWLKFDYAATSTALIDIILFAGWLEGKERSIGNSNER